MKIKVIKKTQSYCNICFKKIPAEIVENRGSIYIKKKCKRHGMTIHKHMWDNPEVYFFFSNLEIKPRSPVALMLEATKRCNLHCNFCYIDSKNEKEDLDITVLSYIDQYDIIQLSGGEPTCRKDLFKVISFLKNKNKKVYLLTNGLKLENIDYVKKLKMSGTDFIVLQFDGFDNKIYNYIRNESLLELKKKVVDNIKKVNIPLALLACIVDKVNLKDIPKFIKLLKDSPQIQMLIFLPVWDIGRYLDKFPETSKLINYICRVCDISKEDFFQSTELLVNLSNLIKNKTCFSKCALLCLAIYSKHNLIPITKIFNIKKLNKKIKYLNDYSKRSIINFLIYFLWEENVINFFKNSNYRKFLKSFLFKLRFVFSKNKLLLNPFIIIRIDRFQCKENYDTELNSSCSRSYYGKR